MSTLVVTNNGTAAFNNLINNGNYLLIVDRVVFSNVSQNTVTLPSQNNLVGTTANGFILTHYYSKDISERLNIVAFLPRKAFPVSNYIVHSIGFFDQNNNMIAAGNITPSGHLVGVIVKASINLTNLNVTRQHKNRIRFVEFYHITFDRVVMNQMSSISDDSCPFENYLYHSFEMNADGRHVSKGIFVRFGSDRYRILVDPNTYLLLGEN